MEVSSKIMFRQRGSCLNQGNETKGKLADPPFAVALFHVPQGDGRTRGQEIDVADGESTASAANIAE